MVDLIKQIGHFFYTFYGDVFTTFSALSLDDKMLVGLSALVIGGVLIALEGAIVNALTR